MNPGKCVFERVEGANGLGRAAEAWTQRLAPRIRWPEGTRFEGIRLARLWVSGDATLTFEHEITLRDAAATRALRIQGRTIAQTSNRPDRVHAHVRYGGLMGLCMDDSQSGLHWCSPDRDRALALGPLFQRAALADWLRTRITTADHILVSVPQTPLAYRLITHRLGKRCVIRIRDTGVESPGIFLKAYAHAPPPHQVERLRTLSTTVAGISNGRLHAPRTLYYDEEARAVVAAEIPRAALALDDQSATDDRVAAALAFLHDLPPDAADRVHAFDDELATVTRWQTVLSALRPDIDLAGFTDLIAELRARGLDLPDAPIRFIHRDFHPGQLFTHGDALWVVDWDTCCGGYAELDLATFSAHRTLCQLGAGRTRDESWCRVWGFLESYGRAGGRADRSRLRWHLALALTRLAALHSARGLPADRATTIWSLAGDLLGGKVELPT